MANKYGLKIETMKTTRARKERVKGKWVDITEEVYVGYVNVTKYVRKFMGDIVDKAILVVSTISAELLDDKNVWTNGIAPGDNKYEAWCERLKSWENDVNLCANFRVDENFLGFSDNNLFIWFTNGKSIVLEDSEDFGAIWKLNAYPLDLKGMAKAQEN